MIFTPFSVSTVGTWNVVSAISFQPITAIFVFGGFLIPVSRLCISLLDFPLRADFNASNQISKNSFPDWILDVSKAKLFWSIGSRYLGYWEGVFVVYEGDGGSKKVKTMFMF